MDSFHKDRTIVCEGELCFFTDAVARPYLYQAPPADVFAEVVAVYNDQVEEPKRFKVGRVTVTDANDYIRLESESAETTLDTLNKLKERCGGYFVFTTDTDGARVINWLAELTYRSSQTIELGENLLNFSRGGANTSLATAVLPYGAKDEATGLRVTIESVNNGLDYIQDAEAVALRGFIIKPVVWDDVTQPSNLLRKAQEYLEGARYIVNSLQLTALDLSYMDKSLDSFEVGDLVRVKSKPHQVDEDFLLTELTEDLLNPTNSTITMGKDVRTLTDADVAGNQASRSELQRTSQQIRADYALNLTNALQETERQLSSLIEQTSKAIKLEVSETYTTNDQVTAAVSTSMEQLADRFTFTFNQLQAVVNENDEAARAEFDTIKSYIRFEGGAIKLGADDSALTLTISNDKIEFKKNGHTIGWWDGSDFHTGNIVVEVNERAQLGSFAFVPRSNGSLSFLKVRG